MQSSILTRILIAWGFLVPVILAGTATAQLGPYDSYYGGWGAYPYIDSSVYNTQSRIAAQQRSATQSRAFSRSTRIQQDIHNTLASEGRTRTQAIQSSQQQGRDWWFQQEQRKLAQQKSRSGPVASVAAPRSYEPAATTVESAGIIKWPPLLKEQRFAKQRAMVELPYLDSATGKPTADEYLGMVKATDQMKVLLKQMSYEINASEYLESEKFLDQLAGEARGRVKAVSKPTPDDG